MAMCAKFSSQVSELNMDDFRKQIADEEAKNP